MIIFHQFSPLKKTEHYLRGLRGELQDALAKGLGASSGAVEPLEPQRLMQYPYTSKIVINGVSCIFSLGVT